MKKQFFFSMLAAAMLVGCSSEEVLTQKGDFNYEFPEGQPAYIAVGLAMPGDAGTRANDDFNDGEESEYEVKNCTLVLFKGATEASATLVQAIEVEDFEFAEDATSNQITSTSKKFVAEIKDPSLGASDKLYAYVVLNNNTNTGLSFTVNQKFTDFSQQILKAIGIANEANGYGAQGTDGLVMTSVPLAPTAGGTKAATGTPFTLTPIVAKAVNKTKAEAEADDAQVACCYVERAAVKVDVSKGTSKITDPANSEMEITSFQWGLGNVNNNASGYYNTRQFDAAWMPLNNAKNTNPATKYRFVCAAPLFAQDLAQDHMEGYRTYFGKDVNYDGKNGLVNTQVTEYPYASGAHTYTYENTFDENSQVFKNTTFVGLKVVLNGGNTFYTVKGNDNVALSQADLKTTLANKAAVQVAETLKAKIEAALKAALAPGSSATFDMSFEAVLGAANPTNFNKVPYTVKANFTNITGIEEAAFNALTIDGKTVAEIAADVLAIEGVTPEVAYEYTNGVTYYATRIAHFGVNETPWSAVPEAYNDYSKIYPMNGVSSDDKTYGSDRANAWLGRWGIVRNNWYSIVVDNITGIGDATPLNYNGEAGTNPDPDDPNTPGDTPDDNPEPKYYISAHIHITPWVKRTQSVEL